MNLNTFPRWVTLPILAALAILSCGFPLSVESTPTQSTVVPIIQTETESLPTVAQSTPTKAAEATITTSSGPTASCTVLQDLNLRFGPGTAYRPRIRVLPANSTLTPLGFAAQGIPGGSWAYVQDLASQDKGWVSAGPQYITCNVEVTALSSMAFGTPPPPPLPNTAQASPGPGTCGKGGVVGENGIDVYDCTVEFSTDGLIQFKVLKNGLEAGGTDGVQNVNFTVTQNENIVYDHTESSVPYCIFGGDGPCNSWVLEDYVYKWEPGGSVMQAGEYTVSISPSLDDPSVNLFWSADITIALP